MHSRSQNAKIKLIDESISKVDLNLSGLTVLTELGSDDYMLLPLIAKLGGADRVIAWTRDSRYGTADDNEKNFYAYVKNIGEVGAGIEIRKNKRSTSDVAAANIITNSGMIRPINADLLKSASSRKLVIPLMYDSWEFRNTDIDLDYCGQRNIKVCGVNENDANFPIFQYVRSLAIKMALNAGYEILENKILVWSGDSFGQEVASAFLGMGAANVFLTNDWQVARNLLGEIDFIYICDYRENRPYFEAKNLFPFSEIADIAPHIGFVHLYGHIEVQKVTQNGFSIYPESDGYPQAMTFTLADAGVVPLVRLITAGLRAAQEIIHNEPLRFAQPI
jgi:hypothetical protein